MAPNGTLLDTHVINDAPDDQVGVKLAFDGEHYLATWVDWRTRPTQVYYSLVGPDGTPLEPEGRRLSPQDSTDMQHGQAAASNRSGFLVAWLASGNGGYVVSAARVSSDGEPLDSALIELTPDSVLQWSVTAGSDGDDYLVVWDGDVPNSESTQVCCCRVSAGGRALDSVPRVLARTRSEIADPAVAYLDGTYLVAWTDRRTDGDIYACRVLRDGTVLDSGGFAVCVEPALQRQPAIAADSEKFVVCWSALCDSTFDVYAASVDLAGHVGIGNVESIRLTRHPTLRAFPNPGRNAVRFERSGPAPIRIFDRNGSLVRVLAGSTWDGRDDDGRPTAAGAYVAVSDCGRCPFVLVR